MGLIRRPLSKFFQFVGIFTLLLVQVAHGEVFTALAEMEELLETEAVLITNLAGYIDAQESKIDLLKKKMEEYQREHLEASEDITAYLSNPINAYLLTKRLTSDWKHVENSMTHDVGKEFIQNITNYRNVLKFPSDEDLNGAAVALMRLQDTYNLDTASVARGELNGIQYSTEMSSNDCFELGRQSYLNEDYYHTVLWMSEAMERLNAEKNNSTPASRADILEYLAFSTYKEGDIKKALIMTDELLELIPNHERANGNREYYMKELANMKKETKLRGDDGSEIVEYDDLKITAKQADSKLTTRKKYEKLCRGDIKLPPSELRKLSCKYVSRDEPFLKFAPFKVEEVFLDPYILMYYDVMSDNEIEVAKKMARPRFRRATVQNSITGELEVASYRISKSAWLKDEDHKYVADVAQRTADMTGLSMETVEELQVVNYGIGGHYDTHYDFARKDEKNAFKGMNWGNRIATVLYYLSDVEQGGATVFPELNLSLWPKKGAAAFWFNLHASGEGDIRTSHAACPVLTGTKWVANKWIHERAQEFRRPCQLFRDHPMYSI